MRLSGPVSTPTNHGVERSPALARLQDTRYVYRAPCVRKVRVALPARANALAASVVVSCMFVMVATAFRPSSCFHIRQKNPNTFADFWGRSDFINEVIPTLVSASTCVIPPVDIPCWRVEGAVHMHIPVPEADYCGHTPAPRRVEAAIDTYASGQRISEHPLVRHGSASL